MRDDEAHRRALALANGDPDPRGWQDLLALIAFVACVICAVVVLGGYVSVSIHFQ